jgi:hypothetical protein
MKKLGSVYLTLVLLLAFWVPVFAQQTYTVTIDTSAVAGQPGAIVFDMVHPNSSDNNATITNFTNGGASVPVTNESVGIGDGSTTIFNHTTAQVPVVPGSVTVAYTVGGNPFTAIDDGQTDIFGTDGTTGSIVYATGQISITFASAPDSGTPITVSYTYLAGAGTTGVLESAGGFAEGDIILGLDPAPQTTIDESGFGVPYFFNELLIPFTSFGSTISFSLTLSQNYDGVLPFDEFSFFVLNASGQTLVPSTDPLLADSLFDICIDGSSSGIFNAYSPAIFMSPGTLNIALKVPPPAGSVINVMPANSFGGLGQNVAAGSFQVQNNSGSPITIDSGTLSQSNPSTFSSLALTGSLSGSPVVGVAISPGSLSSFSLQPTVVIPASGSATFTLTATLNSSLSGTGTSSQMLTLLNGSSSQNSIAISGVPANLGSVSNNIATPTATATATTTPTATATATRSATPTATSTSTGSATPTTTATKTATATATNTATPTPTPTSMPTVVPDRLKVKPKAKNFDKVKVGSFKRQTFTLINSAKSGPPITFGNPLASVPTTSPQVFGFPPGATNCPAQLLPRQKCMLVVQFTPAAQGAQSSAVTIFDNAANADQVIPLRGTGK